MTCLTRREAVRLGLVAMTGPLLACGDGSTPPTALTSPSPDEATRRSGDVVEIDTTRVAAWNVTTSQPVPVVFLQARVIVIRRERGVFTALSAECPHAGCGVSIAERTRLLCPCHGSAFDFEGTRLEGPAPTGLRALTSRWSPATGLLLIQLS
jgi:Rieske Fe-S protein